MSFGSKTVEEQTAATSSAQPVASNLAAPPDTRLAAGDEPATANAAPEAASPMPQLSSEELQNAAAVSKAMMAAYGSIMAVLTRSVTQKFETLAELEWMVGPAVASGQFGIAETQSQSSGMVLPVGILLWASVSTKVDDRLTQDAAAPVRLSPDEWRSGDILWLVDAVGEPHTVQEMLKSWVQSHAQGRPVKYKSRGKDGNWRVSVLPAPGPPAPSS